MWPEEKVPAFGGRRASLQDYEQQDPLWIRLTKMEPPGRAAASVLRMDSVARRVYPPAGGDQLENSDGAKCVVEIPRNYFAPKAAGSIYRELVRFHSFVGRAKRWTSISRGTIWYGARRSQKWKWAQGSQASLPLFCECGMQGFSRQEKTPALACSQKDAAANMRRLFGSCGGAARQDVLIPEDVEGP